MVVDVKRYLRPIYGRFGMLGRKHTTHGSSRIQCVLRYGTNYDDNDDDGNDARKRPVTSDKKMEMFFFSPTSNAHCKQRQPTMSTIDSLLSSLSLWRAVALVLSLSLGLFVARVVMLEHLHKIRHHRSVRSRTDTFFVQDMQPGNTIT